MRYIRDGLLLPFLRQADSRPVHAGSLLRTVPRTVSSQLRRIPQPIRKPNPLPGLAVRLVPTGTFAAEERAGPANPEALRWWPRAGRCWATTTDGDAGNDIPVLGLSGFDAGAADVPPLEGRRRRKHLPDG
uniref:(northern house mosquito) hypothetical protein n=1 Tax=Culex pipiens TaxID=7175 RepID=A0A8D8DHT3_CULPI